MQTSGSRCRIPEALSIVSPIGWVRAGSTLARWPGLASSFGCPVSPVVKEAVGFFVWYEPGTRPFVSLNLATYKQLSDSTWVDPGFGGEF